MLELAESDFQLMVPEGAVTQFMFSNAPEGSLERWYISLISQYNKNCSIFVHTYVPMYLFVGLFKGNLEHQDKT